MPRPRFLKVLPNPWTHIDSDGQNYADPAGFILHDPTVVPATEQQRVGCEIAFFEVLQKAAAGGGVMGRAQIQRTRFRYVAEPIQVMNRPYYRQQISLGHLIAADEESATECGIFEFRDPGELLKEFREIAVSDFYAANPNAPEVSEPLTDAPEAVPAVSAIEPPNVTAPFVAPDPES